MVRAAWRDRLSPPSILLGSLLILTAAIPATAAVVVRRDASLAACPTSPSEAARSTQRTVAESAYKARAETSLSSRGEMTGRRLVVERAGRSPLSVSLPAESFVGQREGEAIVYTRHDERGSEVRLLNVVSGCETTVARPTEIVRSAILDASGTAVFVHSVTRQGRADGGVQRHDLASGGVTSVVPALPAQPLIGPIFGTQLQRSLGDRSLTVQSCGFSLCLSRILDIASGAVATVDAPDQGALIATTDDALITYAACSGLPCAVLAHDLDTGVTQTLAAEAMGVSLEEGPDGTLLQITTPAGQVEVRL